MRGPAVTSCYVQIDQPLRGIDPDLPSGYVDIHADIDSQRNQYFTALSVHHEPAAACPPFHAHHPSADHRPSPPHQAATNQILDDLVGACHPRRMTVTGDFSVRGGIKTVVTAAYQGK